MFLTSCGTAKYEEGYEAGFQQGYDKGYQEGFQLGKEETIKSSETSKYSREEICVRIWNKLPYELPNDYKIEQFDKETRTAEYLGDKRWRFEVYGAGEERIMASNITEEKSDVLWVEKVEEKVSTYNLKLQGDYFESSGILEVTQIDKLNEQISFETVSETILQAQLLVMWYILQQDGWDYHYEGEVQNIGPIPLSDVSLRINWYEYDSNETVLTQEIPVYIAKIYGEQYAGLIPPQYAAHFKIDFQEKRRVGFGDMEFLSSSGEIIPHEIDFEFLKKQSGL